MIADPRAAAAHAEAARVAAALLALGLRGHGGTLADLGFAGLVAGDAPDVDGYLDRVLGPVLAYDERRGSDLAGTLEVYFGCGASPRRAAGAAARAPEHGGPAAGPGRRAARRGLAAARTGPWRSSSPCGCDGSAARECAAVLRTRLRTSRPSRAVTA